MTINPKEYSKQWQQANPEKARQHRRRYYEANKEKINKQTTEYYRKKRLTDPEWHKQYKVRKNAYFAKRIYSSEQTYLARLLYNIRCRCKRRGIECTITLDDLIIPHVCPIYKTPLVIPQQLKGKGYKHPASPSVDRKDPSKGYTKDNIQIISLKANVQKNASSLDELIQMGEWAAQQKRQILDVAPHDK